MGQGNPNKVDAIVEEIVKNNAMFKLKSPVEQEKEKDSMAKSINSAISVLNEAGKELVLQELSVDPDEKFKGFIDGVGNIDISGIIQYTTSVVKNKIEEAEREGINLRRDAVNINKSDKTIVAEAAISMAVITNMISNYENLSHIQRDELLSEDIYTKLSDRDRQELNRKVLEDVRKKNLSEEERKKVDAAEKHLTLNEAYIKLLNENPKLTTYGEIVAEFIKRFPELDEKEIRDFCKKYHSEELSAEENIKNRKVDSSKILGELERISLIHDYNELITDGKFKEARTLLEPYKGKDPEIDRLLEEMDKGNYIEWNESNIKEQTSQGKDIADVREDELSKGYTAVSEKKDAVIEEEFEEHIKNAIEENEYQVDIEIDNFTQNEIKELPNIFINSKLNMEQIQNVLKIYSKTLKSFEKEDLQELNGIRDGRLNKLLKEFFIEDGIPNEMAEILSRKTYNGNLFEILGDSEKREKFFTELDNTIEQIKGPEVVAEEPVQDAVETRPLPEEVSAELNAIPVALQKINCPPEDIMQGMDAYTQIVGLLKPEEMEGTPENITQILQREAEKLGLENISGEILKMMSQITFNGRISEILRYCREEFLSTLEIIKLQGPLLDPRVFAVDPQHSVPAEHIDENTLKAGFSALAVDLQIADQTIIRPEELVSENAEQRRDDQVEPAEKPSHNEGRKETSENNVLKKLQSFFGVFNNTKTSETDLEEEMEVLENLSQRTAEQQLQNSQIMQNAQGNLTQNNLNQQFKEDEDLTQE